MAAYDSEQIYNCKSYAKHKIISLKRAEKNNQNQLDEMKINYCRDLLIDDAVPF